jgi:hypothetical protein
MPQGASAWRWRREVWAVPHSRPHAERTQPNHAVEPTPNSLRSCLAPAIGRGSPPAFGVMHYLCHPAAALASRRTKYKQS